MGLYRNCDKLFDSLALARAVVRRLFIVDAILRIPNADRKVSIRLQFIIYRLVCYFVLYDDDARHLAIP